jgi:transcriptional regulator with XRE-family HTH domain
MNLGSILKKARRQQKLTLKTVAQKAHISEGFLRQAENDVKSPSVATLINICNAVGLDVGEVIKQAREEERCIIIRRNDWEEDDIPSSGFATQRFFGSESRRVIDSAVMVLEKGAAIPARKNIKNGQEVLCVLRGKVELAIGLDVVSLSTGDAVHYWSDQGKEIISNPDSIPAVVLWVGTL